MYFGRLQMDSNDPEVEIVLSLVPPSALQRGVQ